MRAIIVDAIDERAASFQRHFGFESSQVSPSTPMVPLEGARRVLVSTGTDPKRPSDNSLGRCHLVLGGHAGLVLVRVGQRGGD